MTFNGEYWIISVPNGKKQREGGNFQKQKQKLSRFCVPYAFEMPQLRVSAVDELMNLNDHLSKYDVFGRSVVNRLIKSYREFRGEPDVTPTVNDRELHKYIPNFTWDRGHVPVAQKLPNLAQDLHQKLASANDRLKNLIDKYKHIKTALSNDDRKNEGNLMLCDLQKYVKQGDYIEGEYIMTCMVVVPVAKAKQFEETYWALDNTNEAYVAWKRQKRSQLKSEKEGNEEEKFEMPEAIPAEDKAEMNVVVPESAELLHEDKEFALYRVVILKKGLDWFKSICREFRFSVRDFVYKDKALQENEAVDRKKLVKDEADKKKRLIMYCQHSFPECLNHWLHLKMIRVFVESVLRYGLPVNNTTTILAVNHNQGRNLNKALTTLYNDLLSEEMKSGENEEQSMVGVAEMRPYVFIPLLADFS